MTAQPMIEASGLCKYYGSFVAVHDISFSIPRGQVVAFLGPNGAGKTTMMRMLTGYLAPSAGEAAIAGHDVRQDRIAASARLGYLPENGPMYPDMTPLELLRFFGEARRMPPATLQERMDAVVDLCALELVTEKPIGKLSRGYRQRVGMAQALLHDPDVLIMDEPTAGLDPNQIRQFRENIQRLGRTKTLLISTHILHEADAVADRVLLVNSGRLVFDGPVEDLKEGGSLEQPFYRLTAGGATPAGGGDGGPGGSGDEKSAAAADGGGTESGDEAAAGGGAKEKTAGATTAAGIGAAEPKAQTDAPAAGPAGDGGGGGGESGDEAAAGGGAEETAGATTAAGTTGAETKTETDAKAAGAGVGGGESGDEAAAGGGAEEKTAGATTAAGTTGAAEPKAQTDAPAAGAADAGGAVEPEAPGAAADAGGTGGEVPRADSSKA